MSEQEEKTLDNELAESITAVESESENAGYQDIADTVPGNLQDVADAEPEALTSEQMVAALNAEDYKGSELMDVLAELEALITQARSLPMTASVLVNKDESLALLDKAREAMPSDIRTANQIVAGANAVVQRAQEEAQAITRQANSASERIQADAHARAEELVNQERIVVMAKARVEQIIHNGTSKAEELAAGADKYCSSKLLELESILGKMVEQSQAGRKVLSERPKFAATGEDLDSPAADQEI